MNDQATAVVRMRPDFVVKKEHRREHTFCVEAKAWARMAHAPDDSGGDKPSPADSRSLTVTMAKSNRTLWKDLFQVAGPQGLE
ncbi:g2629 [Coccomyxa viridis]|uniref:G2629 protein n=1 Tax=Coccomyxa viridis TaxID=1274662 RepID=A0ABP1FN50_9CHLO